MNAARELSVLITMGARGRHKSEVILPKLEADIRSLVDVQAQADPKFQSTFLYARISSNSKFGMFILHRQKCRNMYVSRFSFSVNITQSFL